MCNEGQDASPRMAQAMTNYSDRMFTHDQLEQRFGYHRATIASGNLHQTVRTITLGYADFLNTAIPDSKAKLLAFQYLETAAMWAHKAIAEEDPLVRDA